jgi:hypothetical protein
MITTNNVQQQQYTMTPASMAQKQCHDAVIDAVCRSALGGSDDHYASIHYQDGNLPISPANKHSLSHSGHKLRAITRLPLLSYHLTTTLFQLLMIIDLSLLSVKFREPHLISTDRPST